MSDPAERARALSDMLAVLATANDVAVANDVAKSIESLWRAEAGDTVNLLLDRALAVAGEKRFDLAEKLIEAASRLAPDYAETWTRRAFVSLLKEDRDRAIADLRRALDGEPNHFRSMDALAKLLRESGDTRAALDMYRRLVKIYPLAPGARQAVSDLMRDVGDRGI